MGRIAKNYIYNVAYQLLVLLTPIITAPYLARVLGAANLGIYSYVNSSGNIITTIALLGIYAYGNRQTAYVRDKRDELTRTFWELELTRLILGIIGTIIYAVYAKINTKYSWYFILYYPYILSQFIDCSWIYVGLEDMKPAVAKNFFAKIVNVVGIFVFVKTENDVWIYIFMLAVTTLVANLSIYFQIGKYVDKPTGKIKNIGKHIKGSVNLFLPQVASLFYLQVDKVMIQWLTGTTTQLSFYDQAEKLINIPLTLITVLSTVMMPRIANEFKKGNKKTIQNLVISAGRYAIFLACPMMMGMLCIAKQFIPWYLGENFLPTAYAMMILSPIVILNSLAGISGAQYFTATNQIGILMKAYVSAAVVNVCVNALLIPIYGYAGAAIATVCSSFISVIIQYFYMNKQIQVKELYFCFVKYVVMSAVMFAVTFLLTYKLNSTPVTTILQICIGGCIYITIAIVMKDKVFLSIFCMIKSKLKIK